MLFELLDSTELWNYVKFACLSSFVMTGVALTILWEPKPPSKTSDQRSKSVRRAQPIKDNIPSEINLNNIDDFDERFLRDIGVIEDVNNNAETNDDTEESSEYFDSPKESPENVYIDVDDIETQFESNSILISDEEIQTNRKLTWTKPFSSTRLTKLKYQ